jgi:hypothetical protein
MRKAWLIALVLCMISALSAYALWLRPGNPPPETAPSAKPEESAALSATGGLAWRDGPSLHLHLKGGAVLTLTDRVTCGDLACPASLATQYRFRGWDSRAGGYLLDVRMAKTAQMLLPFADDPILIDAKHAPEAEAPVALPSPPPSDQTATTDQSVVDWLSDLALERSQSETPLIASSQGKVQRDEAQLAVRLEDGRRLLLTDDLACGQVSCPPQVFRSFDYAGSSPNGRYQVVEEQWDEGSAALLVDGRSGSVVSLLGRPRFSPDGRRLVATVTDLEWSAPRRLEVWVLGDMAPGMEFSLAAQGEDDTVYEVVGWTDAEHVQLRRGPWASPQRSEVTLVHDAAGWHMEGGEASDER